MPGCTRSDLQSEFELKHARQIYLGRRLAEPPRIGDVRANAAETNVIKQVECIGPEDESQILANLKIPGDAQILVKEMRIAEAIGARCRRVTVGERRRRDKRGDVNKWGHPPIAF